MFIDFIGFVLAFIMMLIFIILFILCLCFLINLLTFGHIDALGFIGDILTRSKIL